MKENGETCYEWRNREVRERKSEDTIKGGENVTLDLSHEIRRMLKQQG